MPKPERHRVKELKSIDNDLSVKWDNRIERFIVYHKDNKDRTYPVMKIQYKDGSYKPFDKRTIDSLKYSNHLRNKRPQDILYEIDRENELLEKKKRKNLKDDAKCIASEIPHGDLALKEWAGGKF